MGKIIDLTGQTFGRLTVLSFNKSVKGNAYWNCICGCGKMRVAQASRLKLGEVKS